MIISEGYAKRMIREGKADRHGWCVHDNDHYAIITRYDLNRMDHYYIRPASREYAVMMGATK